MKFITLFAFLFLNICNIFGQKNAPQNSNFNPLRVEDTVRIDDFYDRYDLILIPSFKNYNLEIQTNYPNFNIIFLRKANGSDVAAFNYPQFDIDFEKYPTGVYFLTFVSREYSKTIKVTKS